MRRTSLLLLSLSLIACTVVTPPVDDGGASSSSVSSSISSSTSSSSSADALERTYRNEAEGYTVHYPLGWEVKERDTVITEDYELSGTSIVAPEEQSTLREAKFNISRQTKCPGQTNAVHVRFNDIPFSMTEWSGAGAGNLYEGRVYATQSGDACIAVTFFVHTCNLGPDCGPEHPAAYDKEALFKTFERMLGTFTLL